MISHWNIYFCYLLLCFLCYGYFNRPVNQLINQSIISRRLSSVSGIASTVDVVEGFVKLVDADDAHAAKDTVPRYYIIEFLVA